MDQIIQAIGEPHRRAILQMLAGREMSAGEIAQNFSITRPAISQHLSVLKEAGLLHERRQGTRRLYRTHPEGLGELRAFIEGFWDQGLARLKQAAEREEGQRVRG